MLYFPIAQRPQHQPKQPLPQTTAVDKMVPHISTARALVFRKHFTINWTTIACYFISESTALCNVLVWLHLAQWPGKSATKYNKKKIKNYGIRQILARLTRTPRDLLRGILNWDQLSKCITYLCSTSSLLFARN